MTAIKVMTVGASAVEHISQLPSWRNDRRLVPSRQPEIVYEHIFLR